MRFKLAFDGAAEQRPTHDDLANSDREAARAVAAAMRWAVIPAMRWAVIPCDQSRAARRDGQGRGAFRARLNLLTDAVLLVPIDHAATLNGKL
jgi:hypothetical protein